MVQVFEKPGLLFGVWAVCVISQLAIHQGVPLSFPTWWTFLTFIGAVAPIAKLVVA